MHIGSADRPDRAEFCIGGVCRAGKGRIHSERMLAVSRHDGAGVDHDQRRQTPCTRPDAWEAFVSFVRSTSRAMPPYSETILSDGDLADIYAYLQSIPKPPDANSLPLLKP